MTPETLIGDIRFVRIADGEPILSIRRAAPVVDASGAFCGLSFSGWEFVHTAHFDSPLSYNEHCAMDDLMAAGGIADAP